MPKKEFFQILSHSYTRGSSGCLLYTSFPGIQLRFNDALAADTYNILLSEVPVSQGKLRPGAVLVRDTEPVSYTHLDVYKRQL